MQTLCANTSLLSANASLCCLVHVVPQTCLVAHSALPSPLTVLYCLAHARPLSRTTLNRPRRWHETAFNPQRQCRKPETGSLVSADTPLPLGSTVCPCSPSHTVRCTRESQKAHMAFNTPCPPASRTSSALPWHVAMILNTRATRLTIAPEFTSGLVLACAKRFGMDLVILCSAMALLLYAGDVVMRLHNWSTPPFCHTPSFLQGPLPCLHPNHHIRAPISLPARRKLSQPQPAIA